jgi:hypothetical protein
MSPEARASANVLQAEAARCNRAGKEAAHDRVQSGVAVQPTAIGIPPHVVSCDACIIDGRVASHGICCTRVQPPHGCQITALTYYRVILHRVHACPRVLSMSIP